MSATQIGRSNARAGGVERVTGAQQYVGDIHLDGMLHVKLVHLQCAHARILSIDTRQARQIEGVVCILTAEDLPTPMPRFGPVYQDRPVLATGETKYPGEAVAAVAAESDDAASLAADLIRVQYEELPPVITIDAALADGAPLVQDPSLRADDAFRNTNILKEWNFGWGDIQECQADLVLENTYTFPMVTHFAIEPFAYLAAPEKDGVVIWSAIQHPYVLQRVVAAVLNLPVSKVRIIAPDPGGGFGGKGYPKHEPLLAFLALRTGRPVRLALTLEESFQSSRRTSTKVHMRTGFTADGRLVFQDIQANFLVGAYADIGPRVVSKASYVAAGPYRVPNVQITGRAVLSHTVPATAFRGFGIPQLSFALESQIDEAASRLGIDRVQIRLRNLLDRGEIFIPGDTPVDGRWAEVVQKAADAIGWGTPLPQNRGRGIALGMKNSASASVSTTIVRLHHDASASIMAGTSDMGQGARTVFAQLAAQELGIAPERINVVMGDTSSVPYDASTSASRSTVFMGNAILSACKDIKAQLRQYAAEQFELDEDQVIITDGKIHIPGRTLGYDEFIRLYYGPVRGEVVAVGSTRGKYLPDHPLGGKAAFWEVSCTAAEVEVDVETGMLLIHRLVIAGDVGKALNPQQVEMQDEGGAVMGLGHTLLEQMLLDEHGRILNLGAQDYRIPTTQDIPLELTSLLIENGDGPGPYGAKGTGESGLLAIAPAVAAAVREATGAVSVELPLTPENVWKALQVKSVPGSGLAKNEGGLFEVR